MRREIMALIILGVLLAVSAFEGGYIWRDYQADELRKEVYQQEKQIRDLIGRVHILEGPKKKREPGPGLGGLSSGGPE